MSKQFTAMAVALLAEAGRLSLDDDIRTHLPQVPVFGHAITIRHLIHHTSGLRSDPMLLILAGWRLEDAITNADMLDLIERQRELNFPPGEQYAYSGAGYVLLAELVERVSSVSLAQFCRDQIFEPLGMASTHFHDDYLKLVKNRAYAYYAVSDNDYKNAVLTISLVGGTGLYTSVEDLARWDANFYSGRVGGPALIQQLHQRGLLNDGREIPYAFGHSWSRYKGLDVVEHAGGGPGIRCHMMRFPDARFSVAVLGNNDRVDAVGLARQVADLYLVDIITEGGGLAASAPSEKVDSSAAGAQSVTPHDLSDYAGRYYSPELDVTWTITLDGDRLVVDRQRQGSSPLTPAGTDLFTDE
jgi:CubicO group peptidase (beta-lactamase class C family)